MPQILINREPLRHINFDVELLGDGDVIVNELCHRLSSHYTQLCSTTAPSTLMTADELTLTPELADRLAPQSAVNKASVAPPGDSLVENLAPLCDSHVNNVSPRTTRESPVDEVAPPSGDNSSQSLPSTTIAPSTDVPESSVSQLPPHPPSASEPAVPDTKGGREAEGASKVEPRQQTGMVFPRLKQTNWASLLRGRFMRQTGDVLFILYRKSRSAKSYCMLCTPPPC